MNTVRSPTCRAKLISWVTTIICVSACNFAPPLSRGIGVQN
jgi:hypothetical protein